MGNLSVLIIDDDKVMLKVISNILLMEEKIQIDVVASSFEAISKIENQKKNYDAIICDINMPQMDGIELSKRYYENYPILFITGFLEPNKREGILNLCDAYIEKLEATNRIYPALLKAIERKEFRLNPCEDAA